MFDYTKTTTVLSLQKVTCRSTGITKKKWGSVKFHIYPCWNNKASRYYDVLTYFLKNL